MLSTIDLFRYIQRRAKNFVVIACNDRVLLYDMLNATPEATTMYIWEQKDGYLENSVGRKVHSLARGAHYFDVLTLDQVQKDLEKTAFIVRLKRQDDKLWVWDRWGDEHFFQASPFGVCDHSLIAYRTLMDWYAAIPYEFE